MQARNGERMGRGGVVCACSPGLVRIGRSPTHDHRIASAAIRAGKVLRGDLQFAVSELNAGGLVAKNPGSFDAIADEYLGAYLAAGMSLHLDGFQTPAVDTSAIKSTAVRTLVLHPACCRSDGPLI